MPIGPTGWQADSGERSDGRPPHHRTDGPRRRRKGRDATERQEPGDAGGAGRRLPAGRVAAVGRPAGRPAGAVRRGRPAARLHAARRPGRRPTARITGGDRRGGAAAAPVRHRRNAAAVGSGRPAGDRNGSDRIAIGRRYRSDDGGCVARRGEGPAGTGIPGHRLDTRRHAAARVFRAAGAGLRRTTRTGGSAPPAGDRYRFLRGVAGQRGGGAGGYPAAGDSRRNGYPSLDPLAG